MFKKLVSFLLVFIIAASFCVGAFAADSRYTTFSDCDYSSWYGRALRWATQQRIADGNATKFYPDSSTLRQDVSRFIWCFYGMPRTSTKDLPYWDTTSIKSSSYYFPGIRWTTDMGITNGTTVWTQYGQRQYFYPSGPACTRAEYVTMLWRSKGCPEPTWKNKISFVDVARGSYYYKAVFWAVENGIINGTSPTTFSPGSYVTHAQCVVMLYRMRSMR